MVNSKALERSIRPPAKPQPRCLVNYQILFMLCKPLRIVLMPLEYDKTGIFKINKGPGWHLKPVKLNLKKYKKINVSKIKKVKKIRKKLPKTTEINVPEPSQEVINCVEDAIEDKDFVAETIESVVEDPIFDIIESVVQENSDATKPLKNTTSSRIKRVKKKKSGVSVVNKDQSKTPVDAFASKDQSETPVVADESKDQSETPMVAVVNKDQSKTPLIPVVNKDQSKTPLIPVVNKDQSKTPLIPVVNKDQSKTPLIPVVNKDQSKTPLIPVVNKDQSKTPLIPVVNKDQIKTPVVAIANKDQSKTPVVAVLNKDQSKTPVVADANEDQSKKPVAAVADKDQIKTPVVAVVNKDQRKTPLIPILNKAESKTPTVIVTRKNKTDNPSDKNETISTNNETTNLDLPVFRNVLQQHNSVISSSDGVITSSDDDDDFTDTYVPAYDDISTDEDSNISTEVDDPLPLKEAKINSKSERDVLTVPPNTDPDPNPTTNMVTEPKRYKCNLCELSFIHEQKLRNHELTHHLEDSNILSEVDDPLPRREVKITSTSERNVLTVPPNTNPEPNATPNTVNEPKRYKCNQCELSFIHQQKLRNHELTHYPEDMVQPADCNIEKESSDEFEKEFIEPRKKKRKEKKGGKEVIRITCQFCPAVFTNKKTLNNHEAAHINKRKFKFFCDKTDCNARFVGKRDFEYHQNTFHNLKKYVCNVCDLGYKTKAVLKTHMLVHSDKKFKCKKCGQPCRYKSSLDRHMKRHKGPKNYPCNVCSKSFATAFEVKQHLIRLHPVESSKRNHGIKFKCDTCGDLFTTYDSLKYHLNIHSGNRPYLCVKCPLTFMSPSSLRYHELSVKHDKTKHRVPAGGYPCNECGESFKLKKAFQRHVRNAHKGPEIQNCEVCGKEVRRRYMVMHMAKHAPKKSTVKKEFPCNQCPYIGKYKSYLKKHIQIKHTNEKPYKCKLCPAEFRCYVILKRHKDTHHGNDNNKVQIKKDLKIKNKNKVVETSNEEIVDDPNSINQTSNEEIVDDPNSINPNDGT